MRKRYSNRLDDVSNKATKYTQARQEYDDARKELLNGTAAGRKIAKILCSDGFHAADRAMRAVTSMAIVDELANNGKGRKAAMNALKNIGRTSVTLYTLARGGREIRWED